MSAEVRRQPSFPLFVAACLRMRNVHELIQILAKEHEPVRAAQRERRPLPFPRIELDVRDGFVLATTPLSEIALSFELALKSYIQECAYIKPEERGKLNPAGRNHPFPGGTRLPGVRPTLPDQFAHEHNVEELASTAVAHMEEDGKDPDSLAIRLIRERHPAWDDQVHRYLPLKEHIATFGGLYNNTVNLRYCTKMDPPEVVAREGMDEADVEDARRKARAEHERRFPNLSAALQMIQNAASEKPRSQRPPMPLLCFRHPSSNGPGSRLLQTVFSMLTCLSYWQAIMELALDKTIEHDAAIYPALNYQIEDIGHSVSSDSTYNVRALGHYLEGALKRFDPQTNLGIESRIKAALEKAYGGHKGHSH